METRIKQYIQLLTYNFIFLGLLGLTISRDVEKMWRKNLLILKGYINFFCEIRCQEETQNPAKYIKM